jgi:ABC-2 type transport system permease protein
MPLLFATIGAIPRLQTTAEEMPLPDVETVFTIDETLTVHTGYVDYAELITYVPSEQAENLRAFPDETTAKNALLHGDIESYYVIATDYITSGNVTQYSNNPQLLAHTDIPMRRLLHSNLIKTIDDPLIAARVENPVDVTLNGPPPPKFGFLPANFDIQRLLSAGLVVGLFAYAINVCGALLIRALQREVKMRVLEILITSTTPTQFIGGKMVGLIALALLQVSLTLLATIWVYGNNPDGSGPAALPLTALIFSLPYLFLSLVAYSGMVMSMAAVWPDPRESGLLLSLARLIVMAPLGGVLFILTDLNGPLSVGLTIFPLTSGLLMPFRLLLSSVPLWQWTLGLICLFPWSIFTVVISIRLFRTRGLLTGQSNLWQIWKIIR